MLSAKPCIAVIGKNTRSAAATRAGEQMANVGTHENKVTPQDNQVPPLEEVAMGDQVSIVPPLMTDGEIRATVLNLSQAINSQDNVVTSQFQAMTGQVNMEVGPRVPQHSNTMSSRLRDFNRLSPHVFFGSSQMSTIMNSLMRSICFVFYGYDLNGEGRVGSVSTQRCVPNLVHTMEG